MGLGPLLSDIFTSNANRGVVKDTAARNEALMREFWGQAKEALTPYMDRGNTAGGMYMDALMGGPKAASAFDTYKRSAGYESNLAAVTDATNTSAANRNLLNSGANLKNVTANAMKVNQGYYNSWLSSLALPQQLGAGAAGSLATGAFNFAGMGTQNNNNLASGLINANNSTNNAFQNWANQGQQAASYLAGGYGG